jgi:hypothetical protein
MSSPPRRAPRPKRLRGLQPSARAPDGARAARRRRGASDRPRPPATIAGGARPRARRHVVGAAPVRAARRGDRRRGRARARAPGRAGRAAASARHPPSRDRRREVARLGLAVEVVRGDREAVPVRPASNSHGRTRNELRLEPRLVEPRRLDLPRLVATRAVRIFSRPRR